MPKGTPTSMKCPSCKSGKHGHAPKFLGVKKTGRVERHVTKSRHTGTGYGGVAFIGHRGEVKCYDCGHFWFSTSDYSGRKRLDEVTPETIFTDKAGG